MSDDETSGTTGGSATHNHQWYSNSGVSGDNAIDVDPDNSGEDFNSFNSSGNAYGIIDDDKLDANYYTNKVDGQPPFYELAFFLKVK